MADKKLLDKKPSDKKLSPRSSSLKSASLSKSTKASSLVYGNPTAHKDATLRGAQSCTTLSKRQAPTSDAPSKESSHWSLPIPSQELQGTDEEWPDADSVAGARVSALASTGKESSIIMDVPTQRANELLQQGKNALEKAGNMKKDCKTDSGDCLQGLYEIVLALSDSRGRHTVALEQVKVRAAKELMRCERAHAKELATIKKDYIGKLKALEENTVVALKTADHIKNWLNLELDGPLKTIANTYSELKELSSRPLPATIVKERIFHASGGASPQSANIQLGELAAKMETVLEQLEGIRADIERWYGPNEDMPQLHALEFQKQTPSTANLEEIISDLKKEVSDLNHLFRSHQSMATTKTPDSNLLTTQQNFRESFAPVLTHFEETKKEIAELKDILQVVSHKFQGCSEKAVTEIKQHLSDLLSRPTQEATTVANSGQDSDCTYKRNASSHLQHAPSYAQAARRMSPIPRYNVLVESLDPRHTSDDIVQKLKTSVNIIDWGIGISAIRKSKPQRVIVSCESEGEQKSFSEALRQADLPLSAKQLSNKPPLLKLVGLAKDLNDAQVIEAVLKQNKALIEDVPIEQQHVKIIKRTKGRNDVLTNVIMEANPKIWRALVDQRVQVGYQVLIAHDQSPIMQCYRCLGFGHMARMCTGTATCGYCADHHDTRDCPGRYGPPQCTNCFKDGKVPAPSHSAYSSECPLWQKWDRIARSKVNYC